MVYLISSPEEGLCKIGCSKDPEKRLVELQQCSKHVLTLDGCLFGDMDYEKELHLLFESLRCKGEWFKSDKSIDAIFEDSLSDTVIFESGPVFYKAFCIRPLFISKKLFITLQLKNKLSLIEIMKRLRKALVDESAVEVTGYKNKVFTTWYH